jgi:hypothetical protein
MECKHPWSAKFQLILTKKWLNETYRTHREKLLRDIELSKIPESMPAAETYMKIKHEEAEIVLLRKREDELRKELGAVYMAINEKRTVCARLRTGKEAPLEKKEFVMSCPSNECNGMLSTQYKCGICENFTCPSCHEVIGLEKNITHVCDPNNVASAEAIKKETKQCPGCHKRIFRIEGCSQMWCTGCHTSFDWNTGRKVVGERIHNPHAVEYMRKMNGGGAAPRAPGDVVCGGLPAEWRVTELIRSKYYNQLKGHPLLKIFHLVSEITRNNIRVLRESLQAANINEDYRVRYIVGDIDLDHFSSHIYREDKLRQKNIELLHVFELMSAVGIDLFNQLVAFAENSPVVPINFDQVRVMLDEYNALRIHCNVLFSVISNTYGLTVPQFEWAWVLGSGKFTKKNMIQEWKAEEAEATGTN